MAKQNNKEKGQIIGFHHGNIQVLQDNVTQHSSSGNKCKQWSSKTWK